MTEGSCFEERTPSRLKATAPLLKGLEKEEKNMWFLIILLLIILVIAYKSIKGWDKNGLKTSN